MNFEFIENGWERFASFHCIKRKHRPRNLPPKNLFPINISNQHFCL